MSFKKIGAPAPVTAPSFTLDEKGQPVPVQPEQPPSKKDPLVKRSEVYPRGPFSLLF